MLLRIACALLLAVPAAAGAGSVDDLAWMSGCWRSERTTTLLEECWLPPRSGMMIGVNRTSGEKGYSFEFLRIVDEDDAVVYLASPSGKEAVPFRATELGERRVVFTNPEHDFPQRIAYWLEDDRLHARVEAEVDGEMTGFELVWSRSPSGWAAPTRDN